MMDILYFLLQVIAFMVIYHLAYKKGLKDGKEGPLQVDDNPWIVKFMVEEVEGSVLAHQMDKNGNLAFFMQCPTFEELTKSVQMKFDERYTIIFMKKRPDESV